MIQVAINISIYQKKYIYNYIYIWLVVLTILKNISQLGLLFPIYEKIKTVPNHQPNSVQCEFPVLCEITLAATHVEAHAVCQVHAKLEGVLKLAWDGSRFNHYRPQKRLSLLYYSRIIEK